MTHQAQDMSAQHTPGHYVEIVERAIDISPEVVCKRMGPMCERDAERAAGGARINLNHVHYFVRIVGTTS